MSSYFFSTGGSYVSGHVTGTGSAVVPSSVSTTSPSASNALTNESTSPSTSRASVKCSRTAARSSPSDVGYASIAHRTDATPRRLKKTPLAVSITSVSSDSVSATRSVSRVRNRRSSALGFIDTGALREQRA
jgi:hypothetical protein